MIIRWFKKKQYFPNRKIEKNKNKSINFKQTRWSDFSFYLNIEKFEINYYLIIF